MSPAQTGVSTVGGLPSKCAAGGRGRLARYKLFVAGVLAASLASCATVPTVSTELDALELALGTHVEVLSSDAYGGRKPGTLGGLRTRAYISEKLAAYGYAPGATDGSWEQLVKIASRGGGPARVVLPGTFGTDEEAVESANVVGVLRGSEEGSGAVVLMAHWDHLGECASQVEDRLCNGAVDNASGVAAMLESARLLAAKGRLQRDVYVVATTSEEDGLLGANAFADDPPVPLPTIVAAFNFDSSAIAPRGSPLAVLGWGRTALDRDIARIASRNGRSVRIRPSQERWLMRQDGWALLQRDVPSVLVSSTFSDEARLQAFEQGTYHKPGDEWGPSVELGGAAQDVLLHVALVEHFASTSAYPVGPVAASPDAGEQ